MMVPRSYTYASPPPSPKMGYTEKDLPSIVATEGAGTKARMIQESAKVQQQARLPSVFSPPPSTPSKPVVIPTRTRHDGRQERKGQSAAGRRSTGKTDVEHDQAALSPSMTALLAMTSIPVPRRGSRSYGQKKVHEIKHDAKRSPLVDAVRHPLSSSNPQAWDFLLSPPNGQEVESESFSSDTTIGPSSSVRSFSTDSMPSLEEDEGSLCSASDPVTPAILAGSRGERKKSLSTSKGKDCLSDHPLLPAPARSINDLAEEPEMEMPMSGHQPAALRSRTSFKSNLTASFRAVQSAARSFSDWTMTTNHIHRDDYLSQSLLSLTLPYTVERRPLPSDEPPDPALRRYLNPITLSPTELHFHNEPAKEIAVKACIQLETYQRGSRPSPHASSPPIFPSRRQPWRQDALDTEDPLTTASNSLQPRQREPRENSAFLRMIVLEMNMRKAGKLSGTKPGRAKLWLPARQVDSHRSPPAGTDCREVQAQAQAQAQAEAEALAGKEASLASALDGSKRVVHSSRKVPPRRWVGLTAL